MSFEFFSLDTLQELARLYGYWAVFVGIAIENMGIPFPGETIVIVGGFLAGSGELNYWGFLGTAIAYLREQYAVGTVEVKIVQPRA
jgi:membrane protein DedA with SNARE-associated domain